MNIMICRVYLTESDEQLDKFVHYLKDTAKVRGMSVFRAIEGFGKSGTLYSAKFLDLQTNLPLVVEFFDETEKMRAIIAELSEQVEPEHIIYWQAQAN